MRTFHLDEVIDAIRPAGLANQKGPRIQAVLQSITEQRGDLNLEFLQEYSREEAREWLGRDRELRSRLRVAGKGRLEAAIEGAAEVGGAAVSVVNPVDWKLNFETSLDAVVPPQNMVPVLAGLAAAVEKATGMAPPDALFYNVPQAWGVLKHLTATNGSYFCNEGRFKTITTFGRGTIGEAISSSLMMTVTLAVPPRISGP